MLKASTLLQTGRDEEAQGFFLEALEEFEKGNEKQGEALVLYYLGLIAQREGDLNSALESYDRSLAIATNLKDRTGLILLHSSIGMAHLQSERYDLARPYLEQCVNLLRDDSDQKRLADNLYWLGYALANTGDLKLAERAFEESKSIFSVLEFERVADVEKALSKLREVIQGRE